MPGNGRDVVSFREPVVPKRCNPFSRRSSVHFAMPIVSQNVTTCSTPPLSLQRAGAPRVGGHTSAESVLEAAGDVLEVSHAASANGLSALGLLAPVVCSKGPGQHSSSSSSPPCHPPIVAPPARIRVRVRGTSRTHGRRTLSDLSSGVAAGSAGVLLDVEGAAT